MLNLLLQLRLFVLLLQYYQRFPQVMTATADSGIAGMIGHLKGSQTTDPKSKIHVGKQMMRDRKTVLFQAWCAV